MEAKQMWENFIKQQSEYKDSSYNAWSYGAIPDELAGLTLQGIKTATASAYELYAIDSDPLPQVNDFNINLFVKLSETTALHLHNSKRLPMVSGSSVIFWVYDFFLKPQRR